MTISKRENRPTLREQRHLHPEKPPDTRRRHTLTHKPHWYCSGQVAFQRVISFQLGKTSLASALAYTSNAREHQVTQNRNTGTSWILINQKCTLGKHSKAIAMESCHGHMMLTERQHFKKKNFFFKWHPNCCNPGYPKAWSCVAQGSWAKMKMNAAVLPFQ